MKKDNEIIATATNSDNTTVQIETLMGGEDLIYNVKIKDNSKSEITLFCPDYKSAKDLFVKIGQL